MLNKKFFSALVIAIISICEVYGTLHADGNAYIVKPDGNSIETTRRPMSSKGGLDEATRLKVSELYGSLPLSFIRNDGQLDERVRYYEKGSGHTTYFTKRGVHWELVGRSNKRKIEGAHPGVGELTQNLRSAMIRIAPLGTGKSCDLVAEGMLTGKVNYLKGTDPKKWQTGIPTYESVVYKNIYDGIDMKFYGNNRQMEYDIIVHPGASPSRVQFMYEGVEDLKITEDGDMEIKLREDTVTQKMPYVYQVIDGKRVEVGCEYAILDRKALSVNHAEKSDADNRYGKRFITAFKVSSYNKRYPLVIDPVLVYSTYLGGSNNYPGDAGRNIAVDSSGNAYVTGWTDSTDFPTASPLDGSFNGGFADAFVSKLNASGTALVYSTYLGGSGDDFGSGIAVNSSGNAYVTGWTYSTDFPTASPLDGSSNGSRDVFVSKLNASGTGLVYSTFLGGGESDYGYSIAVDSSGNAYVIGITSSTDFPTASPLDGSYNGGEDAFVSKLNASGTALVYSTYLGGSGDDQGYSIAVDSSGNAYVTGIANSTDFPTASPLDGSFNGLGDAFVSKLNASGTALVYSTYLGGYGDDSGSGIAVNSSGNAYVTGWTDSTDFPTASPLDGSYNGVGDAFVSKLNASGTGLVYSTFLGGGESDYGYSIAVDSSGNAYVTGWTDSPDFPTASPLDGSFNGGEDAFVSKLNASGTALVYSTYLGGSVSEGGYDIAVDGAGNAYVTGETSSTDFPTASSLDGSLNGFRDAFVSKITDGLQPTPTPTSTPQPTLTPTLTPTPIPTPTHGVKGKISGFVADTGGNPIESAKVKAKGVETKIIKKTFSDAEGFFEFAGLEADTYKITGSKKRYKNAKETVELEEGEEKEIAIEMKRKGK